MRLPCEIMLWTNYHVNGQTINVWVGYGVFVLLLILHCIVHGMTVMILVSDVTAVLFLSEAQSSYIYYQSFVPPTTEVHNRYASKHNPITQWNLRHHNRINRNVLLICALTSYGFKWKHIRPRSRCWFNLLISILTTTHCEHQTPLLTYLVFVKGKYYPQAIYKLNSVILVIKYNVSEF